MLAVFAALAIVITASSFGLVPSEQKATHLYFEYVGDTNNEEDIQNEENWQGGTLQPPTLGCEDPNGVICYVKFEGDLNDLRSFIANKTIGDLTSMPDFIQSYRQ